MALIPYLSYYGPTSCKKMMVHYLLRTHEYISSEMVHDFGASVLRDSLTGDKATGHVHWRLQN
jgi:hypothetical protein